MIRKFPSVFHSDLAWSNAHRDTLIVRIANMTGGGPKRFRRALRAMARIERIAVSSRYSSTELAEEMIRRMRLTQERRAK